MKKDHTEDYYKIYLKSTKIDLNKIESFKQMKDWIDEYRQNKKIKVLDIGCGIGYLTNYFKADGLDNNMNAVMTAKKYYPNNKYIYGDISNITKTVKNKYDIIVCYNIIEHLRDDVRMKFFKDIKKILVKEKIAIFGYANPCHPAQLFWGFLTRKVLFDRTHVHNWTIKQFKKEIAKYFTILEEKKTSPFTRFTSIGKYFKGDILLKCKL